MAYRPDSLLELPGTLEEAFSDLKSCFSLSRQQHFDIDEFHVAFETLTDPGQVAAFACRRLQAVAVLCVSGRPVEAGQLVNNLADLGWTLAQLSQHAREPFAGRLRDYATTVEVAIVDVSHYCSRPDDVFDDAPEGGGGDDVGDGDATNEA